MGFDKSRLHSTVHGLAGVKYEQDGVYYSADGREVNPPMVKAAFPELPPVEIFEPVEVVSYQCSKCGRTFAKNQALAIHLRSHK
jgi:hypothetical protein